MWTKHRHVGGDIVHKELPSMHDYHRVEGVRTEGWMANGLRCNICPRAQSPALLTYSLIKDCRCPGACKSVCSLQLTDAVWQWGMQLARQQWRSKHWTQHSILDNLEPNWCTSLWTITAAGFYSEPWTASTRQRIQAIGLLRCAGCPYQAGNPSLRAWQGTSLQLAQIRHLGTDCAL